MEKLSRNNRVVAITKILMETPKKIIGLKNLDKDTYKIIKYGILFSIFLAIIASTILISYILLGINLFYHIGELLIKSSFTFATQFVICGIIVDSIKKQII